MTRVLQALRVGNFKAFADTQRIPLKPITLIFGPNSAGKSSFIHSLAMAHEAQFGREKRSLARLDVHHTDVGGSSIDLGGFRQYVHRGQLNKRVEWGCEVKVAALAESKDQRLAQLLASAASVTLNLAWGVMLDDGDRPLPGAEPRLESIEIIADDIEIVRMSQRPVKWSELPYVYGSEVKKFRIDRLASDHPIFRQVLKAIVETQTTSEEMHPDDYDGANDAISALLPELLVRADQFFPSSVELPKSDGSNVSPVGMLFPVSKGNRKEDIAQAVRFVLPRTLNDLIKGLGDAIADELKQLQYLGPLRSFPPRHLAFAEHEDTNWYAGGGYAWDVVRRDDSVREAVNRWLGSSKLKTPYKLVVRALVAADQLKEPLATGLDQIAADDEAMFLGSMDSDGLVTQHWPPRDDARPFFQDTEVSAERLVKAVAAADIERIRELVLLDQRTNTVVTHRDVGTGISQVLPVLVMAYGSSGKLLAMEQPEIHLHPALQAELGDVFIEAALGERQNTFILETHSEHLILRLMRRIREGRISPDDIGVVFVEPLARGSRFEELRIDEEGDFIDEWPGGFFEESFNEKFAGR